MTRRGGAELRKQPQQARSRAMVDRIVDAAHELLLVDGYENVTTNRVAAAAGVSPGSLYQYFDDKTAILAAVVDRTSGRMSEQLASLVTVAPGVGPRAALAQMFASVVDVLTEHRPYLELVMHHLPQEMTGERTAEIEQRILDLVRAYLSVMTPHSHLPASTSAWILVRTVQHLTVRYVLEQPDIPREQLVDAMVAQTLAHLGDDAAPAALRGLTVEHAMLTEPTVFAPTVTVAELRAWFGDDHVHAAPVVDGGRLIAVVERDDLAGQAGERQSFQVGRLDDRVVSPGDDLVTSWRRMRAVGRRRLAVVDDAGRLVGLLCLKRHGRGFCSDDDVRERRCA